MVEREVLAALLQKKNWLRYGKEFTPKFFQVKSNVHIFNIISGYWSEAKESVEEIEKEILDRLISIRFGDVEEKAVLFEVSNRLYEISVEKVGPLVKEALVRWRAQDILTAAENDLANGDLNVDKVSSEFSSLSLAIREQENETLPSNEIETILSSAVNVPTYPTELDGLDNSLRGGLWSGDLGIILGRLFGGKSSFLTHLLCAALRKGFPALGVTVENSRNNWTIRTLQNLLKEDRDSLVTLPTDKVKAKLTKLNLPPWNLLDYRSQGLSTGALRFRIEQFLALCEDRGIDTSIYPPLIIIDQLILGGVFVSGSRTKDARFQLSDATDELVKITSEYELGIWAGTQAVRDSNNFIKTLTSQHIAECIDIGRKCDVLISLNQTEEEEHLGSMQLFIDKARERELKSKRFPVRANFMYQHFEDFI